MSITAHYGFKLMFFDRSRIRNAMNRATFRALSRFGAFVRTAAKSSIRTRKRSSDPGNPPNSHTGLLKKFIFFGYDQWNKSCVIGPVKLNSGSDAPEILEHGGSRVLKKATTIRVGGPGRDKKGRFVLSQRKRVEAGTRLNYPKRPYMRPAFEKEKPKLSQIWLNSVK